MELPRLKDTFINMCIKTNMKNLTRYPLFKFNLLLAIQCLWDEKKFHKIERL